MATLVSALFPLVTVFGFTIWVAVFVASSWYISERFTWHRLCTLWASVWYLTIQTHWLYEHSQDIPQWLDLTWSLFEMLIGCLLLRAVSTDRSE